MWSFRAVQPVLVIAAAAAAVALEAAIPLSVKVLDEIAPPGGMAQMKVGITEAAPILTGDALLSFSAFEGIDGISMASPDGDAAGIAHVEGTNVALSFVSPTASLGTDSDYPLVGITGRVPKDAPLSTEFPFILSADSIRLFDPSGVAYSIDAKSGSLIVGPSISIGEVVPGSADLPAGAVVSIFGMNFRPDTKVRFDEVGLAQVRYIDSTHIDVVLAEPARMQGLEIKAENPDSRVQFFSYQRTTEPKRSAHPLFRHSVPVFTNRTIKEALVQFPKDSTRVDSGIALENVGLVQANVILEMKGVRNNGVIRNASAVVTLPVNQRLVRDVSELFGLRCGDSCSVNVTSTDPIHVLGVIADVHGSLRPVLPQ